MIFTLPVIAFILASTVSAVGFVGHGIQLYHPSCAHSCLRSVSVPLRCEVQAVDGTGTERTNSTGGMSRNGSYTGKIWAVMRDPSSECKANNKFYLQTMAFCLREHCENVDTDDLIEFWNREVIMTDLGQPDPSKTYPMILEKPPKSTSRILNQSLVLDYPARVDEAIWTSNYKTLANFVRTETTNVRYGLMVFLTGSMIPIGVSLLRFLPWPAHLGSMFKAYFIDPPLLGTRHDVPIRGLAIIPTRGQTIFIACIWIINIVACVMEYETIWPHMWFKSKSHEVETYICHRLGILSFANLSLLILYAGRNNVLLWLTNWSRSTFLLLHRWIAIICLLQAGFHTFIHLHIYTVISKGYYHWEFGVPYWYCGIIAMLVMAIMVSISIKPVRQRVYEVFLATHITFSVLALVACYLHVFLRFHRKAGYENWLHISIAIWAFDRVIRLGRCCFGGLRRAHITEIDEEYLRIDIPNVTASGHVYLHFPSVSTWRFWENHPFSVAGVVRPRDTLADHHASTPEKIIARMRVQLLRSSTLDLAVSDAPSASESGTVLLVRKQGGLTSRLSAKRSGLNGLPVLVEGSYDASLTFFNSDHIRLSHMYPNIICIAGGVGITGILPALEHCNSVKQNSTATKKLFWGTRTRSLVHAVEEILGFERGQTDNGHWGDVAVTMSIGVRMDLRRILETTLPAQVGGTTVVVCGPACMADEVRHIVSGLARHSRGEEAQILVRLVVESFTW